MPLLSLALKTFTRYMTMKRTTVYYCHPYCSSERDSNEKQNGMLRRRHPKGTDFKRVSKKKLRETTVWINNYPRKLFGFHNAAEFFAAAFPGFPALNYKIFRISLDKLRSALKFLRTA